MLTGGDFVIVSFMEFKGMTPVLLGVFIYSSKLGGVAPKD